MPLPRKQEPLPPIPHLPHSLWRLAEFVTTCPQASPDYLFLLADAVQKAAAQELWGSRGRAMNLLAGELRRRAPDYA